jgi:O-antigen ligase
MAQFRRYYKSPWGLTWNVNAGECVLFAFLISATILLFVSWALVLVPGLPWRGRTFGVPVKDYVAQSGIFVLCAFVLFHYALHFRMRKGWLATLSLILAAMFIASVAYIATSRTAIAVFTILLFVFGMWHFGWKGIFASLLIVVLIGSLLWSSSDHFRGQVLGTIDGAEGSSRSFISASTVVRLEIWKRSLELLMQSPLIGHGTGTIAHLFGVPAQETTAPVRLITGNPHNEIFRVGIQIGLVGIAALIAMWISHLMLFHNAGSLGWVGTVVVTQNIVSSLFNSHLADFTQGWLYVFGVGVVGGMVLKRRQVSTVSTVGTVSANSKQTR